MTVHLTRFNIQDYLNTEEDCRLALEAAREEDPGDGSLIRATECDVAEARRRIQAQAQSAAERG